MKLIFYFLFIIYSNFAFSQEFRGYVVDANSNIPVDFATIFLKRSKYTVFTDSKGEFSVEIDSKNGQEILLISCIGYEDLEIDLSKNFERSKANMIFKLLPKIQMLQEVVVSNAKIDYSWAKTIRSNRNPKDGFSFQFGMENVTFVQNPYFKNGKIKKVILSLDKLKKNKDIPTWEIDYLTAYSIKFYKYDEKNQKPGEELYIKNIIVEPENKTYNFVIDVDSLDITFPKEGACVGVEYINIKYKNPKKSFALIGPIMNFYKEEKLKPIVSWSRYRGEDWEFKSSISNFKNRRYQNVMVVDLEVNIEK